MNEKRPAFPVGVNVLVVREGKLLLGKRKNVFGEGSWGLPGGHLEEGENMKVAAARELQEETGLQAISFVFASLVNNVRSNVHYVHAGFIAEGAIGEPQLMEPDQCYEWQWFDLDNLPKNIFIGHVKQIELFKAQQQFADA